MTKRLRLVVFQDAPGRWHARGLEHDLSAEGSTIGRSTGRFKGLTTASNFSKDSAT